MKQADIKKILLLIILFVCVVVLDVLLFPYITPDFTCPEVRISISVVSENPVEAELKYGDSGSHSVTRTYQGGNIENTAVFPMKADAKYCRFGFRTEGGSILITDITILLGAEEIACSKNIELVEGSDENTGLVEGSGIRIISKGGSPWIRLSMEDLNLCEKYKNANFIRYTLYGISACLILDLLIVLIVFLFIGRADGTTGAGISGLSREQWILIIVVLLICLTGAFMLDINDCPDETGRRLLSDYIFSNHKLPTGNETETMIQGWGFSYALRPFLSSMVGAVFMWLASIVTHNEYVLFVMSRMCSVLSIALCCYFCQMTGNLLFKNRKVSMLMATLVCFTPQVLFLGMYQNNDSLSLMVVSMMLYFLLKGYHSAWELKYCVGLGISFSLILLSYYSCYGWLLIGGIAFIVCCIRSGNETTAGLSSRGYYILIRFIIVSSLILLLAGWFFIRNAVLHEGDFFGIASEVLSRERVAEQGIFPYNVPNDNGIGFIQFLFEVPYTWILFTVRSLIGYFGYMIIQLTGAQYTVYYIFIVAGLIGFFICWVRKKEKWDTVLLLTMGLSSLITIALSLIQSYYRDFQPQGRYIVTVLLFISYMMSYVFNYALIRCKDKTSGDKPVMWGIHHGASLLIMIWIFMFIWVWFEQMSRMII